MARRPGQGKIRQEASGIRPLKSAGACKDDERARTWQKEVNPPPPPATLASSGWSLERRLEGSEAVRSRCESATAERSGGMRGGSPLGSPRMDGVMTLLPPFVFESTRFGPWAKLRSGASFKTGRPGPFAGLGSLIKQL